MIVCLFSKDLFVRPRGLRNKQLWTTGYTQGRRGGCLLPGFGLDRLEVLRLHLVGLNDLELRHVRDCRHVPERERERERDG